MKALYFEGKLSLRDLPPPRPAPGEALIRVILAGICNTDLEITQGYMGFQGVLGHEFVGRVESCEDPAWVGKRVVGEINLPCRECRFCRAGLGNHCPFRAVLGILHKDGCFAECLTLPIANLHAVPDAVPDEQAVFVEPLAAALEILEQVPAQNFQQCVVLGDGKLGQLVARALNPHCKCLVVVGKHENKLKLLQQVGIETRSLVALTARLPAAEDKPDLVIEATGSPAGLSLALQLIRPRGTLVLKSTFHGQANLNLTPMVVDEVTLVGSRCGPFAKAIALLASGRLNLRPLLSEMMPLEKGVAAIARARDKNVLKIILKE